MIVHGEEPALDEICFIGPVQADRDVSFTHGKIELRMGKFVLVDHSANGTYLSLDGDRREYVLRREEYALRGHGWFRLGQSRAVASAEVVEFFCE